MMKKFLLLLLLPVLAFANDYKSRFFAGGMIAPSKVEVEYLNRENTESSWDWGGESSYSGFGNVHVYGGWEFRPFSWLSLSPALGFNRNGWSWERTGHTGGISYFESYLRLELAFHIMDFYMGGGGTYGLAYFFWGEEDGKSTTEDLSQDCEYTASGFYTLGYTIKQHYRVGFILGLDYIESHLGSGSVTMLHVTYMGPTFTYLF